MTVIITPAEFAREHVPGSPNIPQRTGLTFAALSGWCGMARLLALMPWNREAGTRQPG